MFSPWPSSTNGTLVEFSTAALRVSFISDTSVLKRQQDGDSIGEAKRHVIEDVRDAIADLIDIIKTYRSGNRLRQVLTSSVFKRREEEANLAIDRAVTLLNVRMVMFTRCPSG